MADHADDLARIADETPRWRRLVPVALAIIFALALGLLIYLANHASTQRERAVALQRHSYLVMLQARTVEAKVGNAEALLARYVVSHDAGVGRQFQDEWATAQRELIALERSTRNNAEQTRTVARLRAAMAERGDTLTEIAVRVRYNQALGALGQLEATRKEASVRAIAEELKRVVAQQERERRRHDAQVNRSDSRIDRLNDSYGIVGLGLLAAVIAALWLAHGARNERVFARRLALAEAARVDDLEAAVRQRTEELREANVRLQHEMEERSHAERSLRHLQKMEALGQLTGGIAHDFNNMLAVVVGGIDIARRQLGKNPERAAAHLDSAIEGASHAAALIERLLAFARSEPLRPDRIDPDALILHMEELIARAIGTGIRVELDLDAGDWSVWAERSQLESALINMAVNARDAMDERGTITIATRRVTLRAREIGACAAGDYVSLTVTDSGSGMTPQVLERVFEPFFTTKAIGKGTGLGLSQIFGFVNQCQGAVDIRSTPGEGTSVQLLLPRMMRPQAAAVSAPAASDEAPARAAPMRILVVEDDARVLRATLDALATLGHDGIACDAPTKAEGLLAAHPDIDLILSDVLMPEMTGPEMIAALGDRVAHLPVVFVTGFAGDKETAAQIVGRYPLLRKPFTLGQLAATIDQAAAARQHAPSIVG